MKLRNRLYLVSGGVFGQLGNVWMVQHDDGVILFDCGAPAAYETIVENLNYWGFNERGITHVFCTHGHDDHAGTAAFFQKAGAKIAVGKGDAYMLEEGGFGERSPFRNHQMPSCKPDILLEGDSEIEISGVRIEIYSMPGHTPGSCIYQVNADGESWLFTGDMFCLSGERGDIAETWWKGDMDFDAEELGRSFAKLWALQLKPDVIGGGHGNPRIGHGTADSIMIAYKYYLLNHR